MNNNTKEKEVTLLSLDTSSTETGWAIFKNGKYKESGVCNWSCIKDVEERLTAMYIDIIQHINKYDPDIIVIERDVVGSGKRLNMSTINTLVKLIGGVWAYCVQMNMDVALDYSIGNFKIYYHEYSPPEWRNIIGIKGNNRDKYKEASIQRIKDVYNLDVNDNEADAINIGEAYIKQWS